MVFLDCVYFMIDLYKVSLNFIYSTRLRKSYTTYIDYSRWDRYCRACVWYIGATPLGRY